jgi:DNA-binding transcriptional ArsR family regulator
MELDQKTALAVAELFRAYGDASRLRVIAAIVEDEVNVSKLAAQTGLTESSVSHHLRGLRQLKMVKSRRSGKEIYYRIDDSNLIALLLLGINQINEQKDE